jgi:ferredoxin/flavodoxin
MAETTHKRIPLFFFSGTGNTWWVSRELASGLQARGFEAEIFSIEQASLDDVRRLVADAAIIGLGFPIYGSDAPRIFHRFVEALPALDDEKPVLGYVTQLAWSGNGINFLNNRLLHKGYRIRWAAEFNMPNNICLAPKLYTPDYARFTRRLDKNRAAIRALCDQVAKGEGYRQHSGLLDAALAWLQRGPFRLGHDWGRKFWSVEQDKCTSCGICEQYCPVENIRLVDGLPVYGGECIYCMRCFNYCPAVAIRYMHLGNRHAEEVEPFQGPVPEFHLEMVAKKK